MEKIFCDGCGKEIEGFFPDKRGVPLSDAKHLIKITIELIGHPGISIEGDACSLPCAIKFLKKQIGGE